MTFYDLVYQDLCANSCADTRNGTRGMTAGQVLRPDIAKALFSSTYKKLAFHLIGLRSLRRFNLVGIADKKFKKSVLHKNNKALSANTLEQINRQLLVHAATNKREKANEVRIDCTGG
jgi:hypothetical protein